MLIQIDKPIFNNLLEIFVKLLNLKFQVSNLLAIIGKIMPLAIYIITYGKDTSIYTKQNKHSHSECIHTTCFKKQSTMQGYHYGKAEYIRDS